MTTRILPTDKNGNVYYGVKTVDAAIEQAQAILSGECYSREEARAKIAKLADQIAAAGYSGVASKVRTRYGL